MREMMRKKFKAALIVLLAAFAVIQLIPYGRGSGNPLPVREPRWDSAKTRELAKRACFDCHSNETVKPWYGWVAPVSWLIWRDVEMGRGALNFSEWRGDGERGELPGEIAKEILEGEMPPLQYRLFHWPARLSGAEKRQLADGLAITAKQSIAVAGQLRKTCLLVTDPEL